MKYEINTLFENVHTTADIASTAEYLDKKIDSNMCGLLIDSHKIYWDYINDVKWMLDHKGECVLIEMIYTLHFMSHNRCQSFYRICMMM